MVPLGCGVGPGRACIISDGMCLSFVGRPSEVGGRNGGQGTGYGDGTNDGGNDDGSP